MSKLKYDESFPAQAEEYASKGMRDIQIARELGISRDTFYDYLRKYPEFADAVAHGRQYADDKVEESGIWRMLGYSRAATVKDVRGHEIKTERQLPPDVSAIIRWLERHKHYADCQEDPAEAEPDSSADGGKYDAEFLEDAERYAAEGYPDLVIARRLRIASSTFYSYRKQYPVFKAALERGKGECHDRIRQKLLDLALGRCTVTTGVSRDGNLRKTTERQLPPNVKAIRYWLAGDCPSDNAGRMGKTAKREVRSQEPRVSMGAMKSEDKYWLETANREVRSQEPGVSMGAMKSEDRNQKLSAQGLSKLSGCGRLASQSCPSHGRGTMEDSSAQGLSELSGCGRGAGSLCSPHGRGTLENSSAQGLSELSGCGRGAGLSRSPHGQETLEDSSAQGLSKLSECERLSGSLCSPHGRGTMEDSSAQGLSELSECGRLSGLSCPPHGRGTIAGKDFDKRFAGMSRKERQRLLKLRRSDTYCSAGFSPVNDDN